MIYEMVKLKKDDDNLTNAVSVKEVVTEAERLEVKEKVPLVLVEFLLTDKIERARATLRNKQTTLDWFKASSQRPTRHRSEPRNKRQLCEHSSTSPSNVDKKKRGCVDDREETDSVSAVSGEGETTKSRSNTIDWFEYRETPQ